MKLITLNYIKLQVLVRPFRSYFSDRYRSHNLSCIGLSGHGLAMALDFVVLLVPPAVQQSL